MSALNEPVELNYVAPSVDVLSICPSEILCTSGLEPGESEGTGDESWLPNIN